MHALAAQKLPAHGDRLRRNDRLGDVGDLTAPKGSREWATAIRAKIQGFLHNATFDQKGLRFWLDRLKRYRGWEQLENRDHKNFSSFEEFLTHPRPFGLGSSVSELEAMIELRKNPVIVDAIDRKNQKPAGRPAKTLDNIQDSSKAPTGTSQAASLRRLRKDRPDLHEKVIAGEMSAHHAAIAAGFRRRTVSVPVDSPHAALRPIIKIFGVKRILDALNDLQSRSAS